MSGPSQAGAPIDLNPSDQAGSRDFWAVYSGHYEQISQELEKVLADDPEFGPLLRARSKEAAAQQRRVSRELLGRAFADGEWEPYLDNLRTQGAGYAAAGLSFGAWFKAVNAFRPYVLPHLVWEHGGDTGRLIDAINGMDTFIDTVMAVIGEAYLEAKERTIADQQGTLRELSTPVLQIREGRLIMPIVGLLDTERARQLTEQLLSAIRTHRARAIVIDITGVPAVDSKVANHLLQTVDACRLMGASVVVTGLSPEIARTLVSLGIDLGRMKALGDLQGGIEEVDRMLGDRLISESETKGVTMSDAEDA